jgi:hypothetical protein
LLAFGISRGRAENQAEPGSPIGGTLPNNWTEANVEIVRPDGRIDTVPVVRRDALVEWSYASTDVPGTYTIRKPATDVPLSMVAVNVPVAESDCSRVATEELPSTVEVQSAGADAPASANDLVAETAVHRWLLYAVLLLLLAESLMAWAFAGRAT